MRKYAAGNFAIKATAGRFKVLGFEAEHPVQASPYVLKQSLVIEKALFGKCPSVIALGERDLDLDMERSIFIGDKPTDMEAGRAAGVGTLLHLDGDLKGRGCVTINQLSQALFYLSTVPK